MQISLPKILVVSLAFVAASAYAASADDRSAPAPMAPAPYNWTGVYAGLFGGGAFPDKSSTVTPKPVKTSEKAREMLRFDLDNENETIRNYRERVRQCETLGEFAMAEQIRQILIDEQDHQIDLATALGEDPPDLTGPRK